MHRPRHNTRGKLRAINEDAALNAGVLDGDPFPSPPNYELHHDFVPASFDLNQALVTAQEDIESLLHDDNITPPKNREEMKVDKNADKYYEAEARELKGIHIHGTFKRVFCPPDREPITCRWTYDIKRDDQGKIVLFKARLVVHGFKQREGVDFHKTFSSTAQIRTFRFVTAVALELGLAATQYDISNAFLNGPIDADIYMKHPPGYPSKEAGIVLQATKGTLRPQAGESHLATDTLLRARGTGPRGLKNRVRSPPHHNASGQAVLDAMLGRRPHNLHRRRGIPKETG